MKQNISHDRTDEFSRKKKSVTVKLVYLCTWVQRLQPHQRVSLMYFRLFPNAQTNNWPTVTIVVSSTTSSPCRSLASPAFPPLKKQLDAEHSSCKSSHWRKLMPFIHPLTPTPAPPRCWKLHHRSERPGILRYFQLNGSVSDASGQTEPFLRRGEITRQELLGVYLRHMFSSASLRSESSQSS